MRRTSLLLAAVALLAARLPAQAFEGAIGIKMDQSTQYAMTDVVMHIKGTKAAITGTTAAGSMAGAGAEIRMLIDWTTMKATILMPLSGQMAQMAQMMPNMKGIQIVSDIPASAMTAGTGIKATGTSETIAGHKCDDFTETGTQTPYLLCLTKELGHFTMPSMGRGGRGGGASWVALIGDNGFPLKVWKGGGKVDFEATSVTPGPVPASLFAIPDGYMDPRAMGGMGRGGN